MDTDQPKPVAMGLWFYFALRHHCRGLREGKTLSGEKIHTAVLWKMNNIGAQGDQFINIDV